jgi:hypothetical protein
MMARHEQLIAFLATLATLIAVYIGTLVWGGAHPELLGKLEVFGLGTITGGLIGILRIPAQRSVTVDNPPSDPVQTEESHGANP